MSETPASNPQATLAAVEKLVLGAWDKLEACGNCEGTGTTIEDGQTKTCHACGPTRKLLYEIMLVLAAEHCESRAHPTLQLLDGGKR